MSGFSTILIADDDPDMRAYIGRCLRGLPGEPARVLEAADGAEALALAERSAVDLIISDVMMPGIDGIELCRAIRRDPRLRNVPVLLITGEFTDREARRMAVPNGLTGILTKPFNARTLCAALSRIRGRAPPGSRPGKDERPATAGHEEPRPSTKPEPREGPP